MDLVPLATYSLVMSITPGPNTVMAAASGARFGFRQTLPHLVGVTLGFGFQALLLCLGLGAVMQHHPALQQTLCWVGAGYLLYLGWRLLGMDLGQVPEGGAAPTSARAASRSGARPVTFLQAALFQWVNPKAWVMATTVALLFVPRDVPAWLGATLVLGVLLVVNFPCMCSWALFGAGLRRWMTSPARRRGVSVALAGSLAATAWLVVRG